MPDEPKLTIEEQDERSLYRMAAYLIRSLYERAFQFGSPALNSEGQPVKQLADTYRWYKSATRPYVSKQTKERARKRRAQSGKPGWGPLVNVLGIRTRLAPRSNQPDQRLTDQTAKALGVVGISKNSIQIGFRGAEAQKVAAHLEKRNKFFKPTAEEREVLVRMAQEALRERLKTFKISGRITVKIGG